MPRRTRLYLEPLEARFALTVFGTDDRVPSQVGQVVRVVAQFPNGEWRQGSGVSVVDNLHILTAGHVLYDHQRGGLAKQIVVHADTDHDGRSDTPPIRRQLRAAWWLPDPVWEKSANFSYDLGWIALRRYEGVGLGAFGLEAPTDTDLRSGVTLATAGYPGELGGGTTQYHTTGTANGFTSTTITSQMDITPGDSGGPLYRPLYYSPTTGLPKGNTVWGIVSHEYTNGTRPNTFVRLTSGRVQALRTIFDREFEYIRNLPPEDPLSFNPPIPDGYRAGITHRDIETSPPTSVPAVPLPQLTDPPPASPGPVATLALAPGQPAQAATGPIRFTVTWDRPVKEFSSLDLQVTAPPGQNVLKLLSNESGDRRTYLVTLSGMTEPGVYALTFGAGVATDDAGNPSADPGQAVQVTLGTANTPPTITAIPLQTVTVGSPVVVPFEIGDAETSPAGLQVTATVAGVGEIGTGVPPLLTAVLGGGPGSVRGDRCFDVRGHRPPGKCGPDRHTHAAGLHGRGRVHPDRSVYRRGR
jgi:V8-like Glu-specific endopeptidase